MMLGSVAQVTADESMALTRYPEFIGNDVKDGRHEMDATLESAEGYIFR